MPLRVVRILVAVALLSTRARAQDGAPTTDGFRARISAYMKDLAVRPLPPGDTLLTWHAGGLVLYHTAVRDLGGVKAGMLRNDRMLGLENVRWTGGAPSSFRATWFTTKAGVPDSVDIRGSRCDGALVIARVGKVDTTLMLPSIPWAVADYGMEELLFPAFDSVGALPYRLAVLRPYGLKWDTLLVTERTSVGGRGWDVITYTETGEQWRLAITNDSHILWLRRSQHPDDDTRPLDGTALGSTFARLLPVLKPATQPTAP